MRHLHWRLEPCHLPFSALTSRLLRSQESLLSQCQDGWLAHPGAAASEEFGGKLGARTVSQRYMKVGVQKHKAYHVWGLIGQLCKNNSASEAITEVSDWLRLSFACDAKTPDGRPRLFKGKVFEALHLHMHTVALSSSSATSSAAPRKEHTTILGERQSKRSQTISWSLQSTLVD